MLLLFRRGGTASGASSPGGWIPPHDSTGPAHFAFAIRAEDLESWREHLAAEDVEIESEVNWDRGGRASTFATSMATRWSLPLPGFGKSTDVARTVDLGMVSTPVENCAFVAG